MAPVRPLSQALAALRDAQHTIASRDDPVFHQRFEELRAWQARHVALFHAERAAAYNGQALLAFLTERFYRDADWGELTARPEKVARAIEHIVDYDRPLVVAVELQAAAESLDRQMTDALLLDGARITPKSYVRAIRRVGQPERRAQQIRWLEELVDLLTHYVDSRAAWWGFKLARTPARTVGLGRTYDLLAEGFVAMRATRELHTATHAVIQAQRRRLSRLIDTDLV